MAAPILPVAQRPFTASARQDVLDAAARLQACRHTWARRLGGGPHEGGRIVVAGDIDAVLYEESWGWRSLLSASPFMKARYLRASLPHMRVLLDRGLAMTSLFDAEHLDETTLDLMRGERDRAYRLSFVPLQMKVVDGREVLLQGPVIDGADSLMAITEPKVLAAALGYWQALDTHSLALPEGGVDEGRPALTVRQSQIVALLRQDLTDEAVARHLGCSVRTVRADVAEVMRRVGARSRFAVAHRLATMGRRLV